MIHRLLSLFLITALFTNQVLACCAHIHDGDGTDRSSRAHVHLGGHSHSHEHGHQHHSGHRHDDDSELDHSPNEGGSPGLNPVSSFDHDSDTVYFADQEQILFVSGKMEIKKSPCCVMIPKSLNYDSLSSLAPPAKYSDQGIALAHALYLQTSRLLL